MFFSGKNLAVAALMLAGVGCAQGVGFAKAEGAKLPAFNAPITETSISGISSGAFMSVQFGVAWSSVIKGVGVVAGGPYYCAQASTGEGVISFGTGALLEAAGPCMTGPLNDISALIKQAQSNGASGAVDATSNIGHQKIYVFHGYNDNVVARSVTDATVKFYRHYLGDKAEGNLFYQSAIGAGHSFVTLDEAKKGLDFLRDQPESLYQSVRLRSGRNPASAYLWRVEPADPRPAHRDAQKLRSVALYRERHPRRAESRGSGLCVCA